MYIERKALLKEFGEEPLVWMDTDEEIQANVDWNTYIRLVKNAPAADVRYVIHSTWEITDIDHAHGHKCYHCPECGTDEWRYDSTNYCPNCGAKMDGN